MILMLREVEMMGRASPIPGRVLKMLPIQELPGSAVFTVFFTSLHVPRLLGQNIVVNLSFQLFSVSL